MKRHRYKGKLGDGAGHEFVVNFVSVIKLLNHEAVTGFIRGNSRVNELILGGGKSIPLT